MQGTVAKTNCTRPCTQESEGWLAGVELSCGCWLTRGNSGYDIHDKMYHDDVLQRETAGSSCSMIILKKHAGYRLRRTSSNRRSTRGGSFLHAIIHSCDPNLCRVKPHIMFPLPSRSQPDRQPTCNHDNRQCCYRRISKGLDPTKEVGVFSRVNMI